MRQLERELPNRTLALRERASEVDRMLVKALREGGDGAALAGALNRLGIRLSDLGRREEALSATEEAVRIYGGNWPSCNGPTRFWPDLAMFAQQPGQRTERSGAAGGGAGSHRRGGAHLPATGEPTARRVSARPREVAQQPGQQAERSGAAGGGAVGHGRGGAHLPATGEPTARRVSARPREVAQQRGHQAERSGRREEALSATEEAVRIRRQLASQRPDAFLPDLARSLGAEGAVLREMGNGGEAVAAFQEGIGILRPFFIRLPGAFRPLMRALVTEYRGACETSGIEADLELLGAILPLLSDQTDAAEA